MSTTPTKPPDWSTFNRKLAEIRTREERAQQALAILDSLDNILGRGEKLEICRDSNGLCFVRKSRTGLQDREIQSTPSSKGVTPRDALANAMQSETLTRKY